MTAPKLPELPPHVTTIGPCMFGGEPATVVNLYTADQMEAYARAAVEASRPTGDNAEHVRVLENIRDFISASPVSASNVAALTAAIAALSQPSVAVTDLVAFAGAVLDYWPDGAPDGGDLQELAVKHGLLIATPATVPCGENCACAEFYETGDEADCYRRAPWLNAALTQGEGNER